MTNDEIYSLLHHSQLGTHLEPSVLAMIMTYGKKINYASGETIIHQGKKSIGIYIVISGIVSLRAQILGENTADLEMLGVGNFLGEISYIENVPSALTIIARHDVECLLLDDVFFEMVSTYYPEIKYKIFIAVSKQVCNRLKISHDSIMNMIDQLDMEKKSLFTKIIYSLSKPSKITLESSGVDINTIQHMKPFSLFSKDEIDELLARSALIKAAKNCIIIHPTEQEPICYIVIQGAVQSCIMHDDKAAKLSVIGPCILFSSVSCVDHLSSFMISFVTCEEAILIQLPASELEDIKKNKPLLWYKIFNLIFKSIVTLEKSVNKLNIRLNVEIYNR